MRIFVIFFVFLVAGCEKEHILVHSAEEQRVVLFLAVAKDGQIFMSNSNSKVTSDELPQIIRDLLDSSTEYSFVIQADSGMDSQAEAIREILYTAGVDRGHVAISKRLEP